MMLNFLTEMLNNINIDTDSALKGWCANKHHYLFSFISIDLISIQMTADGMVTVTKERLKEFI